MFKRFLLLFPYFQRLEKYRAEQKEEDRLRREELVKLLEKEKYWNDLYDKQDAENRRLEDIRESLLHNQRFLKLRISRQTF